MSSALQGLAPREGLEGLLVKMGRTGPLVERCRGTQAGKSGDPRSQNADSGPRAQGAPGLDHVGRRKGKCEAPRALIACGLGRRVAVGWSWAALFPHASLFCTQLGGPVVAHSHPSFRRSRVSCSSSP